MIDGAGLEDAAGLLCCPGLCDGAPPWTPSTPPTENRVSTVSKAYNLMVIPSNIKRKENADLLRWYETFWGGPEHGVPSGACPAQGYTPTLTLYIRALCSQKGAHLQHFKGHMKLDRYLGIYGVIGAQYESLHVSFSFRCS